jgi:hypothetical protein
VSQRHKIIDQSSHNLATCFDIEETVWKINICEPFFLSGEVIKNIKMI